MIRRQHSDVYKRNVKYRRTFECQ